MLNTTSIIDTKTCLKGANDFTFLISEVKLNILRLRQAFIKILILYHFNLACYIKIEIDGFGYVIGDILSKLIAEFD